jgi:ribosome-binding protein aMBF1 (putative translation factor)
MSDDTHTSKTYIPHQDWEPRVLQKNTQTKVHKKHIDPHVIKMAKLDKADEPIEIKLISDDDKKLIRSLRVEKKLSQEDLAKRLSMDKRTINDIESGRHPENKALINKIKTFLNKC